MRCVVLYCYILIILHHHHHYHYRNQGRRPYMEDVDFSFNGISKKGGSGSGSGGSIGVYGVLDGHGGSECSQFVGEELPSTITTILRTTNPPSSSSSQQPLQSSNPSKSTSPDLAKILYESFLKLDDEYCSSSSNNAGSTANVTLWNECSGVAYIANSG